MTPKYYTAMKTELRMEVCIVCLSYVCVSLAVLSLPLSLCPVGLPGGAPTPSLVSVVQMTPDQLVPAYQSISCSESSDDFSTTGSHGFLFCRHIRFRGFQFPCDLFPPFLLSAYFYIFCVLNIICSSPGFCELSHLCLVTQSLFLMFEKKQSTSDKVSQWLTLSRTGFGKPQLWSRMRLFQYLCCGSAWLGKTNYKYLI